MVDPRITVANVYAIVASQCESIFHDMDDLQANMTVVRDTWTAVWLHSQMLSPMHIESASPDQRETEVRIVKDQGYRAKPQSAATVSSLRPVVLSARP